ncbi:hypothetical protein M406DRAFT_71450 [Cryphonectria parasitica EP155]|uniref:ZZ-type domain-containing protein n=1 Tax=Cryphonectria parasitica (strain ATCC 38755 / EP155) TaxID=660469 RepID=A0A9P4Y7P1_CRYP1|nr:uncharacterized protein M406DRAFT_71450 [Cryphonectria parasitica EP155]KAF3768442.1 hypothetical protein M406DRAFT_71450 [Cryphonectria parasitica EP155]
MYLLSAQGRTSSKKCLVHDDLIRASEVEARGMWTKACSLCDASLQHIVWHQCSQCPGLRYCQDCAINIPALHPGHSFHISRPDLQNDPGQEGERDQTSLGGSVSRSRAPQCDVCEELLYDLRYECQVCLDTNLCSSCRKFHPDHALKAITCPYDGESDASCDAEAGGEDEDEVDDEDDVDEQRQCTNVVQEDADSALANCDDAISSSLGPFHDSGEAGILDKSDDNRAAARAPPQTKSNATGKRAGSSYIGVPIEEYQRMVKATQAIEAMAGVAEELFGTPAAKTSAITKKFDLGSLDPEDLAGLDDADEEVSHRKDIGDDDEDNGEDDNNEQDSARATNAMRHSRPKGSRRPRVWTPQDRKVLRERKLEGWTDQRVGDLLGRSAGAVAQQWRKQK